jgi:Tfp pilus assembly protein PilX
MKKCQVLLFVFLLISIVSILGVGLANMWQAQFTTQGFNKDSLTAFYLAQAGLEKGKAWVKDHRGVVSNSSVWDSNITGGRFRFDVTTPVSNRLVIGTGQANDSSGRILAQRMVNATVNLGASSPNEAVVGGSWQEQ